MNEVDDLETETSDENIVTVYQVKAKPDKVTIDTGLAKRYGGVVIKGRVHSKTKIPEKYI